MLIDLLLALITAYAFYLGYSRGIVRTLFSVVSLLIGIAAAMKLSPIVIGLIENLANRQNSFTFIAGFVVTFMVVLILIRFLGRSFEKILKKVRINFVNKILGGTFLALVFIVCFSFVLWFSDEARLINESVKKSSYSYEYLEDLPELSKQTIAKIKPLFRDFWDKTIDTMDNIRGDGEKSS